MTDTAELEARARVTRDAMNAVCRSIYERDGPTQAVRHLRAAIALMTDDDLRYLRRLIR